MKKFLFFTLLVLFFACTHQSQNINSEIHKSDVVFEKHVKIHPDSVHKRGMPEIGFSFSYPNDFYLKKQIEDSMNYALLIKDTNKIILENLGFGICKLCNLSISKISVKRILQEYMKYLKDTLPFFESLPPKDTIILGQRTTTVKFNFNAHNFQLTDNLILDGKYLGFAFILYPPEDKYKNAVFVYFLVNIDLGKVKNYEDLLQETLFEDILKTVEFF